MRHLIIILFCLFSCKSVIGQKNKIGEDEVLFQKAILLQAIINQDLYLDETINSDIESEDIKEFAKDLSESILDKCLEIYEELIEEFPKSKFLFRALNNKGYIELMLEDTNEAKQTFTQIIESNAKDNEKGGVGSGLMSEPYANYKNRASTELANIYMRENKFYEALQYLELTKKYPYKHFCGNEYEANKIYMSTQYAKCYLGLNEDQKAIAVLLPQILTYNTTLINLTLEILLKTYSKEALRSLYEQSFKNYTSKIEKVKKEVYENYYITFLGSEIKLDTWEFSFLSSEEKSKAIDSIYKNSKFYQLLNE